MIWKRLLTGAALLGLSLPLPLLLADPVDDRFNFATGLLIKEEYALAAEEFEELLADSPQMEQAAEATFRVGDCHWKLKQLVQAQAAFERVLEKHGKSEQAPQALYRLGQLHTDPAASAAAYARLAKEWPDHALAGAARYWAGESSFKAEQFDAASEQLAGYLADSPSGKYAPHATYALAWCHLRQERYPQAHHYFTAFGRQYPKHELANECGLRAADVLHKQGKHAAALEAYRPLTVAKNPLQSEALLAQAWVLADMARPADAAAAFVAAAAAQSSPAVAATCWFNGGNAYIQAKRFGEAQAAFRQLLAPAFSKHDLSPEARYWEAYAALKQGKHKEAIASFKAMRTQLAAAPKGPLAKHHPDILLSLGEACSAAGDHASAAAVYADLAAAFRTHATAPDAAYAAVLEFDAAQQQDKAIAAAETMIATFPDHTLTPLARFALAEFAFRGGDYARSLKTLEQLSATNLTAELQDDYTYKRAWSAFHCENYPQALALFQTLAGGTPPSEMNAEAAFMAGRACEALDRASDAIDLYTRCARAHASSAFAAKSHLAVAQLALDAKSYEQALAALGQLKAAAPADIVRIAGLYKGEALLALNRLDEAEAAYRSVKDAAGKMPLDAAYGMAWACYRRSTTVADAPVARKLADAKSAAAAFATIAASADSPRSAEAAFWLARSTEEVATLSAATPKVTDGEARFAAAAESYTTFLARADLAASGVASLVPEARYRQAFCAARAGDSERAGTLYRAVASSPSPFAANALYDHAWLELDADNSQSAQALFEALVTRFPKSELTPDARFRLGTLAFDAKAYARAVSQLEALATDKTLPYADHVLYKLAWANRELDQIEKAATRFRQLAEQHPGSPLAAEARYRAGRALQALGRPVDALSMLQAVPAGRFSELALFHTGELQRAGGNTAAALTAYQAARQRHPDGELATQTTLGLAHCQRDVGAFADAIESYAKVVAMTDTIAAAHALVGSGMARMAMKQYKAATKDFLKVDILYGYDEVKPQALQQLVVCYGKLGNAEKAAKYTQELQTRYPE